MRAWLKHPLRVSARLLWLAGELILAAIGLARCGGMRTPPSSHYVRALWLQHSARRVARVFGVQATIAGLVPARGLLVCNHLSYIDILVLASATPCVFVAKRDVNSWPVFGWFARRVGTVFVHREKRTDVGRVAEDIQTLLEGDTVVVLFPEGTSSDGSAVLPFKSSLLEPAVGSRGPLAVGWIHYELDDGDAGEEVCYWKDMTFGPHAFNLLSKRAVRASVKFASLQSGGGDRKELARQLHAEVVRLKESQGA